jgi:hypothetical protein
MCTVQSDRQVMVCDVSRDRVQAVLLARLGDGARFETVHGEGTRFTCVDPERVPEFQASVGEALGWEDGTFPG